MKSAGLFGIALVVALVAARSAAAETVVIARADCAALVAHQPDADVAYTPGVDVHGRAVAPADLGDTPQIALPDMIEIPITVELGPRFGIPATPNLYKGEAEIGRARVSLKDGRVWFNGRPLASDAQQELARLCQRYGTQGR